MAYNVEHNITPESVQSSIESGIEQQIEARKTAISAATPELDSIDTEERLEELQAEMIKAADEQRFEDAAKCRDEIRKLKGETPATPQGEGKRPRGRRKV